MAKFGDAKKLLGRSKYRHPKGATIVLGSRVGKLPEGSKYPNRGYLSQEPNYSS